MDKVTMSPDRKRAKKDMRRRNTSDDGHSAGVTRHCSTLTKCAVGGRVTRVGVGRGLSKRVEDGHRLATLQAGDP
jgi:hypothetical protein